MTHQIPAPRMSRGDRIQFAAGTAVFAAVALVFAGCLTVTGYNQALIGGFLALAGAALIAAVTVTFGIAGPQPVPAMAKGSKRA